MKRSIAGDEPCCKRQRKDGSRSCLDQDGLRGTKNEAIAELAKLRSDQRERIELEAKLRAEIATIRLEKETLRQQKDGEITNLLEELKPFQIAQEQAKELARMQKLGRGPRLRRFTWFPEIKPGYMDEVPRQPSNLPELPDAVLTHLTTFLDEDSRFELRVLNSAFYAGYFEFRTSKTSDIQLRNVKRALKLTTMGRVFKNVTHLKISEDDLPFRAETGKFGECKYTALPLPASGAGFPHLKSINVSDTDADVSILHAFAGCATITNLCVNSLDLPLLRHFPALRSLGIIRFHENQPIDKYVFPHPRLEEIRHQSDARTSNFISEKELACLSRKKFPRLKRVRVLNSAQQLAYKDKFEANEELCTREMARLKKEGIEILFEEDSDTDKPDAQEEEVESDA